MKYFNPQSFEKELEQDFNKIKDEALTDVSIHVENPNASIETLLGEVRSKIDVLKTKVEKFCSPRFNQLQSAISRVRYEETKLQLEESIEKNKELFQRIKIDCNRIILNYSWHFFPVPILCIAILVGGDVALNFRSLQMLLPNMMAALIVGVIVAISLGLAADATASKILTIHHKMRRRLFFFLVNVAAFCLFLFLGFLRIDFYQQEMSLINNPVTWSFFSLLFFNTAVFVSHMFLPSKEEKDKKNKRESLDKQCRVLAKKIKQEEKALEEVREKHANILTATAELDGYRKNKLALLDRQQAVIFQSCRREYQLKGGSNIIPFPTIH